MKKHKNKKHNVMPPLTYLEVGCKYRIGNLVKYAYCIAEESEYYILIDTDNNEVLVPKNKVSTLSKVSK